MKDDLISRSEEQYPIDGEELFNRVQKLKHYEVRQNLFDDTPLYEVFKCQDVLDAILASERLDVAPAVDAVPVVRCRDCKWWGLPEGMYATENVKHCEFGRYMVASDGYCVYGEVKDAQTN